MIETRETSGDPSEIIAYCAFDFPPSLPRPQPISLRRSDFPIGVAALAETRMNVTEDMVKGMGGARIENLDAESTAHLLFICGTISTTIVTEASRLDTEGLQLRLIALVGALHALTGKKHFAVKCEMPGRFITSTFESFDAEDIAAAEGSGLSVAEYIQAMLERGRAERAGTPTH